jgi:hypothetical protein
VIILSILFGYILHCVCCNLYCGGFILFCNVWAFAGVCARACVGFVMCGCFGNVCTMTEVSLTLTEIFLTLTEVFPCFFRSCKANTRIQLAKTGTARTLPN